MTNKNILITGAGRGIGKRLAIGLAAKGARVGLLARSKTEIDLAKLEIEHAGGLSLHLRADVRDLDQLMAAAERMRVLWGSIDVLIAAAGIQGPIGPFLDTPPKAWAEAIETNLIGVANSIRSVIGSMIERRKGKIIVLSGCGSLTARPNFSAYAAAKTGVVRLVETIAAEVSDHNVQVNCMAPGGSYTSMTDEILEAGDKAGWKEIEDATDIRTTGGIQAEKQIHLAAFLSSEASNHISGKVVHVTDDWKKLERTTVNPELFTLRRVQKM